MDINEKIINKYIKEKVDESEDGAMGYLTAHPHGGRGRQGHNKGVVCPHCGKTITLER